MNETEKEVQDNSEMAYLHARYAMMEIKWILERRTKRNQFVKVNKTISL